MVTLICCVRRLPHLSHAAFDRHWRENHAALIRKHAAALRDVMEDEARFVDLSKSRFWFGEDRIIIAPTIAA